MLALYRNTLWICISCFAIAQASVPALAQQSSSELAASKAKIVFVAGKPSHPPGMHEFNAGVQLLCNCLEKQPGVEAQFVLNGWPEDEAIFDDAAAVIFYMDGNKKHEVVQGDGTSSTIIDEWTKRGVGIGCMHYGVEVVPEQAGTISSVGSAVITNTCSHAIRSGNQNLPRSRDHPVTARRAALSDSGRMVFQYAFRG